MQEQIRQSIKQAIKALQANGRLADFDLNKVKWEVAFTEDLDFGDYASNIGLQLASLAKKNPLEIAQLIADEMARQQGLDFMEKTEAVKGYVNFFLKKEYLLAELGRILVLNDRYGASTEGEGKTAVIDYSAPNIAKPFGIGHLRSTIIGQAIYNIYSFLGYQCVGDNHLGDWGTQFGKLIYQIKTKGLDAAKLSIEELEKIYVEFHEQAKDNPALEDEARAWFKKLEEGDQEAKAIWQACWEVSMKEFNRIYELLGVKMDQTLGESFYLDKMQAVFAELQQKGLTEKSEGAWVIRFPNEELPTLPVIKSDGATTYFLRDLATIKHRLQTWQPTLIIYEVGVDQSLHFRQLFKTAEMLGWNSAVRLVHVAHGLMRSKAGKFSTRKGETIHLEAVLREAVIKAQETIENSETDKGLSIDEKQILAKQVGIGAIKYNDLSQHHSRDMIFDWDKILNIKGNSGPYLQYTHARCQSVLQKSGISFKVAEDYAPNSEERQLLQRIVRFAIIIQNTANLFSPNLACNYIYILAQEYNLFYAKHSILQADTKEQQEFRLALTASVAQVIKNGLTLLGIATPNRM